MSERISLYIDEEVYEYLQTKDNMSAHVQRLVKADMKGVDTDLVGLAVQKKHFEREAQAALEKHERYQEQLEEITQLEEDIRGRESAELEKAREKLQRTPKEPTNPAIQEWAERLGMEPTELCEELQQ